MDKNGDGLRWNFSTYKLNKKATHIDIVATLCMVIVVTAVVIIILAWANSRLGVKLTQRVIGG